MTKYLILTSILLLGACSLTQTSDFASTASAIVATACADFHAVEASKPFSLTKTAVGIFYPAATDAIGMIEDMGNTFCAVGPPAGDTTTDTQRAFWVESLVPMIAPK